ncbi:heme peroxidase [Mycena olivaceomarginata]|nr:heme peroxidase [Mycena olivaceomarginata]
MSFSLLRASARRTAFRAAAAPRTAPNAPVRVAFRKYSTPPPAAEAKSNTGLIVGVLAAVVVGGGGYYYFSQGGDAETALKSGVQAVKSKDPLHSDAGGLPEVYNKIAEVMDDAGDYDDGSYGPVLLRLAWHSSGTYDVATNTGGRWPESLHGANAGLNVARDIMEKVKAQFPWISYGDLWTLGGVAAIPWRPGRIDGHSEHVTPDGRLPDASQGIFGRMGSGFVGPWTFSPTTLTNDYFKLLFTESWVWKKWNGPKQLEDKSTKTLMMLPTDYVIISDKGFKKFAKAYADDNDLFFKDFSAVVAKLFELGVPTQQFVASEPWLLKTLDEQKK